MAIFIDRHDLEGEYAVVASLGGAKHNPVWYYNLKKNPHVELQDGATRRDYTAREVTGVGAIFEVTADAFILTTIFPGGGAQQVGRCRACPRRPRLRTAVEN